MSLAVRLAIALFAMAAVLVGLNLLVLRRAAAAFKFSRLSRRIVTALLAAPFLVTVFFRALGGALPVGFGEPAVVAASAAEMGVILAAGAMLVAALGRWIFQAGIRAGNGLADGSGSGEPEAEARPESASPEVTRRAFVEQAIVGSALVAGGTSATYGALFGRHDYELSTVPVPIPGLSRASDGFTLVQLSDIHLGQMVGEAEMRAAEELVRKAKGDLIVLTGDLIDHDIRYGERLGRLVRRLGEIRPVVAIPGNHDYYTGIDEVLETLRKAGATVLVNESTVMLGERGGFVLAGLDDGRGEPRGGGPNLARALAGIRSDAPRIVLSHNPKTFMDNAGDVALQLSGHTHGGQVNVGVPLAEFVLRHGYVAGLYQDKGSRLYVNRGFGTAGPAVRVGAPPEVTRIVLLSG